MSNINFLIPKCPLQAGDNIERYKYIEANSIQPSFFKRNLDDTLRTIPKRIVSSFCKVSEKPTWDTLAGDQFEEYLSLNEESRFRISPAYLIGTQEVQVKFQGAGYGDFTVCMSRNHTLISKECKSVEDIGNAWFNFTQPCRNQGSACSGIYFGLQVDTTYMKCSESDCRFHDDVRIIIRPEGLRCEEVGGVGKFAAKLALLVFSLFVLAAA